MLMNVAVTHVKMVAAADRALGHTAVPVSMGTLVTIVKIVS